MLLVAANLHDELVLVFLFLCVCSVVRFFENKKDRLSPVKINVKNLSGALLGICGGLLWK